MSNYCMKLIRAYRNYGISGTIRYAIKRLNEKHSKNYHCWSITHLPSADELETQRNTDFQHHCTISIAIATYNTKVLYLQQLVESILSQTYSNWEACFYDGGSNLSDTLEQLKRMSHMDPRIHIRFGRENYGISGNCNQALEMCTGDYVAFCDHDDLLTANALYEVEKAISQTDADVLYSDEDKVLQEKSDFYFDGNLKPDFSPDTLRSSNYICHLMVMKRMLAKRLGGFRSEYDGSQDYDLMLRATEVTNNIYHISKVLYHWRMHGSSMSHAKSDQCVENARKALQNHLDRMHENATVLSEAPYQHVSYTIASFKMLSVIIWNQDKAIIDYEVIDTIIKKTNYRPLEIITYAEEEKFETRDGVTIHWVEWTVDVFHLLNKLAHAAAGEYLCFLHNQIEPDQPNWAAELVQHAQRPSIGVVVSMVHSVKPYVLHAGYAIGRENIAAGYETGHSLMFPGYFLLNKIIRNIAAASCAYFVLCKDVFVQEKGFCEDYGSYLADVDLCQRLLAKGMKHIYTPYAPATYRIKGGCNSPFWDGKSSAEDAATYRSKWPHVRDPYYNEQFRLTDACFHVD